MLIASQNVVQPQCVRCDHLLTRVTELDINCPSSYRANVMDPSLTSGPFSEEHKSSHQGTADRPNPPSPRWMPAGPHEAMSEEGEPHMDRTRLGVPQGPRQLKA